MVQLLADPTVSHHADTMTTTTTTTLQTEQAARDEHVRRIKELHQKRTLMQKPRRGYSLTEAQVEFTDFSPSVPSQPASGAVNVDAAIPENSVLRSATPVPNEDQQTPLRQLPLRKKAPPRRSQSVTDKEPETVDPSQPQPCDHSNIVDLPPEIHYTLLDFLDPIDAACLGLTNSRLYSIHKRKNPNGVPLSSRYSGPNDLEWAWRSAHRNARQPSAQAEADAERGLEKLRVKGQVYCRKCGISRCELHRHLKDWMGDGYEYCEIKERFGAPAADGAKTFCYMASPKDRHRCGRHGAIKQ